jgi:hypothetical protein
MYRVHFPDSKVIDDSYDNGQGQQNLGICEHIKNGGDWNLARCVVNHSYIRWALGTFNPFKSAVTDGITPALLQQGEEHVIPHLCHIFRACMAYGFIPTAWRQVKAMFIPKPGKLDYTEAKAYRPRQVKVIFTPKPRKLHFTEAKAYRPRQVKVTFIPKPRKLHYTEAKAYRPRQVKAMFIPKPRKLHYTKAKAYRPINLLSFLLTTMEKLVDRHITDSALKEYPLHQNQHAYQTGKSTETTLHNVVTRTENATAHKDIALGTFLDIEGAFDRTSFDIIKQAAERHGIEPAVCRWISAMLEHRN